MGTGQAYDGINDEYYLRSWNNLIALITDDLGILHSIVHVFLVLM